MGGDQYAYLPHTVRPGEMVDISIMQTAPVYIGDYASEYKLQDDEYFVLGDNRGNSNDSHAIGPIPRSMIIAHVRQVIWPLNAIRPVKNEHTELVSPE